MNEWKDGILLQKIILNVFGINVNCFPNPSTNIVRKNNVNKCLD